MNMFDKQVGICGEHGGEPSSVAFFAKAGLDYVSCSPFRYLIIISWYNPLLVTDGVQMF